MAVSLITKGVLNGTHASILIPALFLMGAQLQYMGRLLGVADTPKKYWPLLMLASILNAGIAMIVTCGGLGVWVLVDLVLILLGSFRDESGRALENW